MKAHLPLKKNELIPLAKNFSIPLGLTAAASATDAAIQKKIYRSGFTALIIWNKEIGKIMKTVKSLEESGLLIEGAKKQLKMKQQNKKRNFLACYYTLAVSLLGNMLVYKVKISWHGARAGTETIRAGQDF